MDAFGIEMTAVYTTRARVTQITPLTDSIVQIILSPENDIEYIAGQYMELIVANEACAYSIANAPLGTKTYELHIRHSADNGFYQQLMAQIKATGGVDIRLPLGTCHLDKLSGTRPLLFIAAGTGYAPINAMIELLLAQGDLRPFNLYWAARTQQDLYLHEKVMRWQAHVRHFVYQPVLSSVQKRALGTQVIGDLGEEILARDIIISGPFDMVYATRDALVGFGVNPAQLFSDAFAFEGTGG